MRDDRERKKGPSTARAAALAVLAGVGLLAALFIGTNAPFMKSREDVSTGQKNVELHGTRDYQVGHDPRVLRINNVQFQVLNQPVTLRAQDVAEVAVGNGEIRVYGDQRHPSRNETWPVGGGGGAGQGQNDLGPTGIPAAEGPVYVRAADGRYLPLRQLTNEPVDEGPRGLTR